MMTSWTSQMGYPVLKVTEMKIAGKVAQLSVEQSWFLTSGDVPPDERTWCLPIFVQSGDAESKLVVMKSKTMDLE
eukprot:6482545-Amphidinium_carterae.1